MKGLRYDRKDPWQQLAELWDLVLANPIHSPFCSCRVPGGLSIDAKTIAQDLIDYLSPRYRAEGCTQLADLLDACAMTPRSDFIDWLREIASSVPEPEKLRLIEDMVTTLSSMRDASSGSIFICR